MTRTMCTRCPSSLISQSASFTFHRCHHRIRLCCAAGIPKHTVAYSDMVRCTFTISLIPHKFFRHIVEEKKCLLLSTISCRRENFATSYHYYDTMIMITICTCIAISMVYEIIYAIQTCGGHI